MHIINHYSGIFREIGYKFLNLLSG